MTIDLARDCGQCLAPVMATMRRIDEENRAAEAELDGLAMEPVEHHGLKAPAPRHPFN